jgi:hypothetical protein
MTGGRPQAGFTPGVDRRSFVDDAARDYPWVDTADERFTLALVLDVGEVLVRHGYRAPTGVTLVELTAGLYRALHDLPGYRLPPPY